MLRIEVLHGDGDLATLSLEGRIIGPWVEELRQICDRILATGVTLSLDLAEVAFVDHVYFGGWNYNPRVNRDLGAERFYRRQSSTVRGFCARHGIDCEVA